MNMLLLHGKIPGIDIVKNLEILNSRKIRNIYRPDLNNTEQKPRPRKVQELRTA